MKLVLPTIEFFTKNWKNSIIQRNFLSIFHIPVEPLKHSRGSIPMITNVVRNMLRYCDIRVLNLNFLLAVIEIFSKTGKISFTESELLKIFHIF